MPVAEFVRTQNHPLVLKVFDKMYGINKENIESDSITERLQTPLQPIAEARHDLVQWPGRAGYSTYFAESKAAKA